MAKHLKILGREAERRILDDETSIKQLIYSIIQSAGMAILGQPQLHRVELEVAKLGREPFEDEGGISCLACLSTSHVALHTWPLRNEFHLDIYSCRSFDPTPILHLVHDTLHTHDLQVTDVSKACEWPDESSSISEVNGVLKLASPDYAATTRIRFGSL